MAYCEGKKKGKIFNYYEQQVSRTMLFFILPLLILETPFKPSPNVGQIVERKIRKIECTNADIGMLNINIDLNLCLSKESHQPSQRWKKSCFPNPVTG